MTNTIYDDLKVVEKDIKDLAERAEQMYVENIDDNKQGSAEFIFEGLYNKVKNNVNGLDEELYHTRNDMRRSVLSVIIKGITKATGEAMQEVSELGNWEAYNAMDYLVEYSQTISKVYQNLNLIEMKMEKEEE
ncbi:hypothetical protein CUC43_34330 (plasmid) [Bacillus thuringiensis LM1212]|uniref:hypothetical protein n=1 Tax=Bacillus cereus group TaxID=86661 RepID=UPI000415890E|nr:MULTISPECIES: hypothetical protein [Bacillus cereus group]AXY11614.1 hypothetical protein CUC43_34245 [Bacillus thuringiensis LM1212]AXY11630.1 hypothetical protein CUC43_34330 [Bacillus thuringiensis LM1212]QDF27467.1 hypothetical protein FJR70_32590 [Bacillus tropicus]QDF27482.1 hypothetical protein FJR70_32675 [Bacillus tropicus]QUG99364.1 hypothetical protein HCM98_31640 [Bacillus tropicus]